MKKETEFWMSRPPTPSHPHKPNRNAWRALTGLSQAEAQAQYAQSVRAWYGDDAVTSSSTSSSTDGSSSSSTDGSSSSSTDGSSTPSDSQMTKTPHRGGGGGGGGGGRSEDNFSLGSNQMRALGAIGVDGLIAGSGGGRKEGGRKEGGEEEDEEHEAKDVFYYAKRGMVEEVMARLEEGGREGEPPVGIDVRDEEGRTLLHWAVDGNHQVLAEFLLARGADVTAKDGEGETCLDYASLCEHEALVEVLVKKEAEAAVAARGVGRRDGGGREEKEVEEGEGGAEKK